MTGSLGRLLVLLYGIVAYTTFLGTLLYAVGFITGQVVPKSMNTGEPGELVPSLLVNAALLIVFALQHSVMARPGFKAWWTRFVPTSMERPTYVLFTNVAFVLLFWLWRPLPDMVWSVEAPALRAVIFGISGLGWLTVLLATFMINHFDLFGLRQVWLHWRGEAYSELGFRVNGLYRVVRHPIQAGFLIAFWATPDMSLGHLVFALGCTGYILVALRLEERDLVQVFGDKYRDYRKRVSMLLPLSVYKPD